ncbi:MAG: NAD-dependent epimerase/dehydratase family protein [Candidatus Liptonbacteria bacterium]|nr:NAD-dependent epimerase/dehydratase family protein [Candidatus Liptonbacteria bacterium]
MRKKRKLSPANSGISIIEEDCKAILPWIKGSDLKGKKILITGASGFLGQYVVQALVAAKRAQNVSCEIVGIGRGIPGPVLKELLLQKEIRFIKKDLSRPFALEGRWDVIFHGAGYGQPAKFLENPSSTVAVNVAATQSLLEHARKSRGRFIFFSSAEVYGDIPAAELPVKETYNGNPPLHTPRAIYGESKRLGESLSAFYASHFGITAKIVRISHVYGPGLSRTDTRVMSDFIRKALEGKQIALLDEGRAVKTYGYIADVIAMILYAGFHGKEMVYNVGGKDSLSIRELAKKIGKECGASVVVPKKKSTLRHIGREPQVVKLDLSKIQKEMGKFPLTSFDEGLERTIEWAKSLT